MRCRFALLALVVPLVASGAQAPADEAAIRARIAAHGQASAAGDARALSEVYADDAELVAGNGNVTRGRQAIDDVWKRDVAAGAARGGRHHMHPPETIHIRFVTSDVALVDVGSRALGGADATGTALPPTDATLLTIWRKNDGVWRVTYQRPLPARPSAK